MHSRLLEASMSQLQRTTAWNPGPPDLKRSRVFAPTRADLQTLLASNPYSSILAMISKVVLHNKSALKSQWLKTAKVYVSFMMPVQHGSSVEGYFINMTQVPD